MSLSRATPHPAPLPALPRERRIAPEPHQRAVSTVPAETLRRIADAAPEADRTGSFPTAGIAAVHEAGLLHATVAPRYGGPGADEVDIARIIAAIGRVDPSVALIVSMTLLSHWAQARKAHWPESPYRHIVEEGRRRPILLNAARVEPELGSPARGGLPQTLARRTQEGWRISGTKRFVTGSEGLTHFLVWASTDESPARVGTFIVEAQTPGIRIVRNWNSLGMRATSSHDVVFEDVLVPADFVTDLTQAGAAAQDNRGHAVLTLVVTALYLGVGEAALDAFLAFAKARVPAHLGRPIAETERIIAAAGEIDLLVTSARQILFDALISSRRAWVWPCARSAIPASRPISGWSGISATSSRCWSMRPSRTRRWRFWAAPPSPARRAPVWASRRVGRDEP